MGSGRALDEGLQVPAAPVLAGYIGTTALISSILFVSGHSLLLPSVTALHQFSVSGFYWAGITDRCSKKVWAEGASEWVLPGSLNTAADSECLTHPKNRGIVSL